MAVALDALDTPASASRARGVPDLPPHVLNDMDEKGVIVSTADGAVISVGRLKLSAPSTADAQQRLDLHFETELMRCVLRVPQHRLEKLAEPWDGTLYRYVLPAGDQLWRKGEMPEPPPASQPIIETFSIPLPVATPAAIRKIGDMHEGSESYRRPRRRRSDAIASRLGLTESSRS